MKEQIQPRNYEAYRMIKDLILDGQLSPGQKLIYRDLEEKISMSKTPIINGLLILEKDGLVTSKRNRGFYVCDVDSQETYQVIDLKEKLEEIAVEYAIKNCTPEDLRVLKEKLNAYKSYEQQIYDKKRLLLDTEFHLQIVKMGKNRFLLGVMRQFYENMYFRLRVAFLSPHIKKFKKEHNMLFEAIRLRKLREAKQILRSHTMGVVSLSRKGNE